MITQAQLKELLDYCPETGVFTWKVNRRGNAKAGGVAGYAQTVSSGKKYWYIKVFKVKLFAHRLAVLYMTGSFPEAQVDHEDGNGTNNRWSNLRCVGSLENGRNRRRPADNTSGVVGVGWCPKSKRFYARIRVNWKRVHLGCYKNFEDAVAARKAAEVTYGFHKNHGIDRPL